MNLAQPLKVKNLVLKNRIMFPPLTTGYEKADGVLTDQSIHFYKRLAEGGAGYIVIGDVAPVNTISPTPKLHHDGNTVHFKRLADEVHAFGCKVAVQIFHPEYDVDGLYEFFKRGDMEGGRKKLQHDMTHYIQDVTTGQLDDILVRFGECAKRAQEAGIDIIEIHGDRLVGSLCSEQLNHRTDEFGGSFENRIRFALSVVRVLKEAVPDMVIEYKLPIVSDNPLRGKGGVRIEEGILLARELEKAGVDMLHVAQANHTGNMGDTIPAMGARPYGFFEEYARTIKKEVAIAVSTSGRIVTPAFAEAMLANGSCDMVGIGRGLLADPDWPIKALEGQSKEIRYCIMCNKGCTDSLQNRSFIQCIINAQNGFEYQNPITPASVPKHVVIAGGGVAGMEAARVASQKGYRVTLLEREAHLGGQLQIASAPPRKEEMLRVLDYLDTMVRKQNVELRFNVNADADYILSLKPDEVLLAVGASNLTLPIKGCDRPQVVSAWELLAGRALVSGTVAIIGGGFLGMETAEYLAVRGYSVKIIEMTDTIAKGESETIRPLFEEEFQRFGVEVFYSHTVMEIKDGCAVCSRKDGGTAEISCDCMVMAAGAKANDFDTDTLERAGIRWKKIGDCREVADIGSAIRTAYQAANEI